MNGVQAAIFSGSAMIFSSADSPSTMRIMPMG